MMMAISVMDGAQICLSSIIMPILGSWWSSYRYQLI